MAVRPQARRQGVAEAEPQVAQRFPEHAELRVPAPAVGLEIEQRLRPGELRLRLDDVGRLQPVAIVEQADARADGEFRSDRIARAERETDEGELGKIRRTP